MRAADFQAAFRRLEEQSRQLETAQVEPVPGLAANKPRRATNPASQPIMNWNDADTSVGKQFAIPVAEVLDECAHALRLPRRSSARRAAGVPAGRGDRRPGSTETSPRPARSRPSPAGRRVTATRRSPDSPDCRSLRQETAGNGR